MSTVGLMAFPPAVPTRLDDGVVFLTPYEETDAGPLFDALDDPRCWEHIPRDIPGTRTELHRQIIAKLDGHRLTYTIRSGGQVVGTTSVIDVDENEGVEIGATQLAPTAWGTGVNARSKDLLTAALFAAGSSWVQFRTDERNARSAAAIRKLGAMDLGVRQDARVRRDGSIRASAFFRLNAPAESTEGSQE